MNSTFLPFWGALSLGLALCGAAPVSAQNVEDLPIEDAPVLSAQVTPAPPQTAPVATATVPTTGSTNETVTIPRSVWEQILRDLEDLKKSRGQGVVAPAPGLATTPVSPTDTATENGSRNYLLLPDISFIADAKGLYSSDKRDEGRNTVDVEGEISIQGYVYPGVKYDAFLVANPGEDEPFGLEEGYVTLLGAAKNLNVQIGRKFAAFGRTGELHPHSWLYSRQLLARQNMVAGEALVGQGVQLNYLLPTGKNLFARLQIGAFTGGEGAGTRTNTFDSANPFGEEFPGGPGAGFSRFYNARLWMGTSLSAKDELDFGVSYARGRSSIDDLFAVDPDNGEETVNTNDGRVSLSGVDVSFRRFLGNNKRLLLRGEYFRYKPQGGLTTGKSDGYYGLVNFRFNKQNDIGFLYEKSDYPNAPGENEKALSLIYTKQFAERYYVRLMGTRGDRPGERGYNEVRLQFVTGLGPHTHELE